jgi:hypothetical protein
MVRPLGAGLLCALIVFVAVGSIAPVGAAGGDKVLNRVKGGVGYQLAENGPFKPIFGPFDVPDDAFAVTQAGARGSLQLRDSSVIDLGERTSVQVGAFNMPGVTNQPNQITVNHGALKFTIHHPQGVRSNYTFSTPTSQIAVRGTEAYLVVGPKGTQVVCVDCAPGDVTITINGQPVSLQSGQTITISNTSPATYTVEKTVGFNSALRQFLQKPPAGPVGADPTGYAVSIGNAAVGGLTLPLVAGGAVVGAIAVSGSRTNPGVVDVTPTPTPTPTPTRTPTPTPISTSTPTPTPTPISTSTAVPTSTPTPTPTPTPTTTPIPTPIPYSALNVSPTVLTFNSVPQTQTFTVQQTGPGGTILIGQATCNGNGASASVGPQNFPISANPSAHTITVTAQAAPNVTPAPVHACLIPIAGGGGQNTIVYLDISSTNIGISGRKSAQPTTAPAPVPTARATPTPTLAPKPSPTRAPEPGPHHLPH